MSIGGMDFFGGKAGFSIGSSSIKGSGVLKVDEYKARKV
jgi:hypothetical protein